MAVDVSPTTVFPVQDPAAAKLKAAVSQVIEDISNGMYTEDARGKLYSTIDQVVEEIQGGADKSENRQAARIRELEGELEKTSTNLKRTTELLDLTRDYAQAYKESLDTAREKLLHTSVELLVHELEPPEEYIDRFKLIATEALKETAKDRFSGNLDTEAKPTISEKRAYELLQTLVTKWHGELAEKNYSQTDPVEELLEMGINLNDAESDTKNWGTERPREQKAGSDDVIEKALGGTLTNGDVTPQDAAGNLESYLNSLAQQSSQKNVNL